MNASARIATTPAAARNASQDDTWIAAQVTASHWSGRGGVRQLPADDRVRVVLALQPANARIDVEGHRRFDGMLTTSNLFVAGSDTSARFAFDAAYDCLELSAQTAFVEASACARQRRTPPAGVGMVVHDHAAALMARSLVLACGSGCAQDCLERAAAPIFARAVASFSPDPGDVAPRRLPRWRMQRVDAWIASNLHGVIRTRDLAEATGLSSGHFTTTFRATTGLAPHAYVQQRRLERAQQMLLATSLPIGNIARDTGFRTHAHFTTVFKRAVGQTPNAWRRSRAHTVDAHADASL